MILDGIVCVGPVQMDAFQTLREFICKDQLKHIAENLNDVSSRENRTLRIPV